MFRCLWIICSFSKYCKLGTSITTVTQPHQLNLMKILLLDEIVPPNILKTCHHFNGCTNYQQPKVKTQVYFNTHKDNF